MRIHTYIVMLNTDGTPEDLERRYRDLVNYNNSQIGSKFPLNFSACVTHINAVSNTPAEYIIYTYYTCSHVHILYMFTRAHIILIHAHYNNVNGRWRRPGDRRRGA